MKEDFFVITCANATETMIFFHEMNPSPTAADPEGFKVYIYKGDVEEEKKTAGLDNLTRLNNRAKRITENFYLKQVPTITEESLEHAEVFPDDDMAN